MLHHPRHALPTPARCSPCPGAGGAAGAQPRDPQNRRFHFATRPSLRGSELRLCRGEAGGNRPRCSPKFRLGRPRLSSGRRHLARAQAVVRSLSLPRFLRMCSTWSQMPQLEVDRCQVWCAAPRCPKSCASFVSSVDGTTLNVTLVYPIRSYSCSTSRTSKASPCGSNPRFTPTAILT